MRIRVNATPFSKVFPLDNLPYLNRGASDATSPSTLGNATSTKSLMRMRFPAVCSELSPGISFQ